jgi:hypothetical protein
MKKLLFTLLLAATAYTKAAPQPQDFRIHNGKLYNVTLSTNWTRLVNRNDEGRYVILKVSSNEVVAQEQWMEKIYDKVELRPQLNSNQRIGGYAGNPIRSFRQVLVETKERTGKTVYIRNFIPDYSSIANVGDTFHSRHVIEVGTYLWRDQTIQAYDCGLPNTPENRKLLNK